MSKFKVAGKTNNLQDKVVIEKQGNKIVVNSSVHFSKSYLKYLAKKFMKKNMMRDWLRLVASDANSYELRYYNINQEEEEADEE